MREFHPSGNDDEFFVLHVTSENVFEDCYYILFAGTYSECKQWQLENGQSENPQVIGFMKTEPCKWTRETADAFLAENRREYVESISEKSDL